MAKKATCAVLISLTLGVSYDIGADDLDTKAETVKYNLTDQILKMFNYPGYELYDLEVEVEVR